MFRVKKWVLDVFPDQGSAPSSVAIAFTATGCQNSSFVDKDIRLVLK